MKGFWKVAGIAALVAILGVTAIGAVAYAEDDGGSNWPFNFRERTQEAMASILGIDLSSVVELGTVTRDSLAPHLQARVDAHDLIGKEEGQLFLRTLGAQ